MTSSKENILLRSSPVDEKMEVPGRDASSCQIL